ncbi:hypothetical protein Cni_G06680 [Canna indica]|uniref:Uncharacterized protein n=1 Tax=Canna indica TaxID=4628 RepID=A0AAQ3Q6N1_9LILI|nr:hypothetical protein Cni_G06680 [Canna indica]
MPHQAPLHVVITKVPLRALLDPLRRPPITRSRESALPLPSRQRGNWTGGDTSACSADHVGGAVVAGVTDDDGIPDARGLHGPDARRFHHAHVLIHVDGLGYGVADILVLGVYHLELVGVGLEHPLPISFLRPKGDQRRDCSKEESQPPCPMVLSILVFSYLGALIRS